MIVTRSSVLDDTIRTMEIDISQSQLDAIERSPLPIQVAAPFLTTSEREFIMTGLTDDEWDDLFLDEEDYHDEPNLDD